MKKLLTSAICLLLGISGADAQQLNKEWVRTQNGMTHSNDKAIYAVQDLTGNIYTLSNNGNSFDYNVALVKTTLNGVQLWSAYALFGASTISTKPTGLAVDPSGGVWAVGTISNNDIRGYNFAVARYSPSGVRLWGDTLDMGYDGLANAVIVDSLGDGYVIGANSGYFAIAKYNATGTKIWTKIDTLTAQSGIAYRAVAKGDYIYVEGTSGSYGSSVVKYEAATGKKMWEYGWNTVLGSFDNTYKTHKIVVDNAGNVTWAFHDNNFNTSIIIKIAPDGTEIWEKEYRGLNNNKYGVPTDLVSDAAGDFYMLSSLSGQLDVCKYSGAGNLKWSYTYTGSGNTNDESKKLAIDNNGNLYATGRIYKSSKWQDITICVDTAGNYQWERAIPFPATTNENVVAFALCPPSGGVTTVGQAFFNYDSLYNVRFYHYNSAGTITGNGVFAGIQHANDWAHAQLLDARGNLHVSGYSPDTTGNVKVKIVTYSPFGNVLQTIATKYAIDAKALAVDSAYCTYIAGYAKAGLSTFGIAKYSAAGLLQWTDTIPFGNILDPNQGPLLQVSPTGNCYFSCHEHGPNFDRILIIKYDINGQRVWTQRYIPSTGHSWPLGMVIDEQESLYITGSAYISSKGYDMIWLKYDKDGNLLHSFNAGGASDDVGAKIVIDKDHNSYVGIRDEYNTKTTTVKIDANGQSVWSTDFVACGGASGSASISHLTIDAKGRAYITGTTGDCVTGNRFDLFVVRYTADGQIDWQDTYQFPVEDLSAVAGTIGVDSSYNMLMTFGGNLDQTQSKKGITLVKYNESGNVIWTDSFSGITNNGTDAGMAYTQACIVRPLGDIYLSGYSNEGNPTHQDFFTLKYTQCTMVAISVNGANEVCKNSGTTLSATLGYHYKWTPVASLSNDTIFNPIATPSVTTTYVVIATDNKGCTSSASKIITVYAPVASLTLTHLMCFDAKDGSISATVTGGLAPYKYAWSNGATMASNTGLTPGTYTLTVTDDFGCVNTQLSATITEPTQLVVVITTQSAKVGMNDGKATAGVTGGTPPYAYKWDDSANQTSSTASNLPAGTYHVTVTDKNNCTLTKDAIVQQTTIGINELAGGGAFNVHYYSVQQQLTFQFNLTTTEKVQATLYNIDGGLVTNCLNREVQTGRSEINVMLDGLEQGAYLLQWQIGKTTGTYKLLIFK